VNTWPETKHPQPLSREEIERLKQLARTFRSRDQNEALWGNWTVRRLLKTIEVAQDD